MLPDAEFAIIGAGPAGSALAVALGRDGHPTILLDRSRFPRDKPCGEGLMPAGVRALADLGLDLVGPAFPALRGVRYRLPGRGEAFGAFRAGPGRGVRRLRLDARLATLAASTPEVDFQPGVALTGITPVDGSMVLTTSAGQVRARALVGADGLRSTVRRLAGWERPPRPPFRHAVVGHLEAPGHGLDEIVVTLLARTEVYLAPTTPDELSVATMGGRGSLRVGGRSVSETYRAAVREAHPELAGAAHDRLRGVGPFRVRPARVAGGRIFLLGDAAGFIDPLTGDAISAGLLAARALARFLDSDLGTAPARYRDWIGRRWRRRSAVGGLALALTRSERLANRALVGLARRPAALETLLEINQGGLGLSALGPRDWAALAGL